VGVFKASFDATWKELGANRPGLGTEAKVALMKKKLATRILVTAARTAERRFTRRIDV
jgi:hypothetical protein